MRFCCAEKGSADRAARKKEKERRNKKEGQEGGKERVAKGAREHDRLRARVCASYAEARVEPCREKETAWQESSAKGTRIADRDGWTRRPTERGILWLKEETIGKEKEREMDGGRVG